MPATFIAAVVFGVVMLLATALMRFIAIKGIASETEGQRRRDMKRRLMDLSDVDVDGALEADVFRRQFWSLVGYAVALIVWLGAMTMIAVEGLTFLTHFMVWMGLVAMFLIAIGAAVHKVLEFRRIYDRKNSADRFVRTGEVAVMPATNIQHGS